MKRLAILLLVSAYSNAYAWGVLGHKIVAQVAQAELSPKALAEIGKLIPKQTLQDVAVWADQVRNTPDYKYTAPWHYADVEDGETYENSHHDPAGDVVAAITKQVAVLKSKAANQNEKIEALKFIVHFMGDLHQPLHVGRPNDHGGNTIKLSYRGRNTNLHALWDSSFIEEQGMGINEFAKSLEGGEKLDSPLIKDFPLTQVVNEDLSFRKDIYNFKGNTIDEAYAKKATGIVSQRLQIGGKRLALLLNSIFN